MHIASILVASICITGIKALSIVHGTFDSQEVRPWDVPGQEAYKLVTFPELFSAPLMLALGLTRLDISNGANIRVSAGFGNATQTSAYLHLNTWADTRLYSAASVWFAIASGNQSLQTGQFATTDDHPWYQPQQNTSRRITFARPYAALPRVVVWLNIIDMDHTRTWRIHASATEVTTMGFTLHIDTWADSILYTAAVTWIAYPSDMPDVWSGDYSTSDVRYWDPPQLVTNGTVNFPAGLFQSDPTVLLALNHLDVGYTANLRMVARADPVAHTGMTWHFDSWADSVIYSAGAAYLAFA